MAVGGFSSSAKTHLGLGGTPARRSSFAAKALFVPDTSTGVGSAPKRKRKPAPRIQTAKEFENFRIEREKHIREVEQKMWANSRSIAQARKETVVMAETRFIAADAKREAAAERKCALCGQPLPAGKTHDHGKDD